MRQREWKVFSSSYVVGAALSNFLVQIISSCVSGAAPSNFLVQIIFSYVGGAALTSFLVQSLSSHVGSAAQPNSPRPCIVIVFNMPCTLVTGL